MTKFVTMPTKVVGIKCGYSSNVLEVPSLKKHDFEEKEKVVFKDEEGKEEFGVVVYVDRDSRDEDKILFASKILRRATPNDLQKVINNKELSIKALTVCKTLADKLSLGMNIFKASYSFDGSKVYFLFTSDDRVDFRDLVKELAKSLQKQIHLRQIGPRDKARSVGGYGRCGRSLCCSTWLGELGSIGMEMVRVQALEGKGSSKLSGSCGKLLCCLKYEVAAYRELKKTLPSLGSKVAIKGRDDAGVVITLDILNQKLKVAFHGGDTCIFDAGDVKSVLSDNPNR